MKIYNNNLVKQIFNILVILKILVVNRSSIDKKISALLVFITSLLVSLNIFAAAGDTISNTATISYDLGGVTGFSNATTTFTEDRRINFVVAEDNGGAVVPVISNMTNAVLQFTVTNLGNAVHDFLLTAVNTAPNPYGLPADNFDPLPGTFRAFAESGATPGYQASQDTAVFVDELPQNASKIIYLVADMPAIVLDDVAAVALIAQVADGNAAGVEGAVINADDNGRISPAGTYSNGSTNVTAGTSSTIADTLGMDTVFNDPAGANLEDVSSDLIQDITGNGQHSDVSVFQVTPTVLINKSVTVIDTLGAGDPHSGATLRYQLEVNVAANIVVDNLIVSDVIPANTSYTDGSIVLNGVPQTDISDAPVDYTRAIDISSKPVASIEVDLSQGGTVSVSSGATNVIIFEVTIN